MLIVRRVALYSFLLISGLLISCNDAFDELPETLSYEEQLAKDIEIIDAYLDENSITANEHESGLRYVMNVEGTGDSPVLVNSVTVTYEGTFLNGGTFDSNSTGITFPLQNLIESWQIAIPLMKEGGSMTIYAPSGLCYGASGTTNGIPPNANMIFNIDLIEIAD